MTSNLGFNCMPLFSLCIRALTFLWVLLCCVQLLVTGESAAALNTEERLDFCYLPPKTGPCRAAFHSWFFNNKTNKCEQFIYGGCNGNQNNFETEANCAETCKASQTGNKTSGDNFLHHENGQGGNNLPGKNGDDENEQKEKDSMGKTAKEYFELLNKGIHPEKSVPFLPQPRIFKRSARSLKKQTKEYGASLPISEHNLQTGNKTSGEDERNGKGSSGQNGDGEDRHKEKSLTGEKGDDETRQKAEGLPGQNGDGEDSHKEKSLTGEKGDDETRQKAEGLPRQNRDGEDRDKEKSLTGVKGDDETRPKAEGLQGQNGDGEDRHKEKSLTGEKGDDGTRPKAEGLPGQNGDGEDRHKEKSLTGEKGDDETRPKAEGLPGQNGDGEDSHKEKSLTGEKGDDETRQKAEGLPGQNGDGEDRHKEKSLTGEKGDDGTREGNGEEPPLNQATGDDNNANREVRYSSRRGPEGNVNGGDFRLKDRKSGVYGDSDSYEHTSSHFAGFFLTSIVLVFAVYAVYHNRQKIVAIIIEGRNDNRSGKRGYRKLETNVEEAMPAMKTTHSTYVY